MSITNKELIKDGDNVIPQHSTDTPNDGTGRVSFTVKELLTDISKKIDIIDVKLDAKAEKTIVETLDRRVAVIETTRNTEREAGLLVLSEFRNLQAQGQDREKRLTILETSAKDKDAWKILWVPLIFNGLVSASAILYVVLTHH